MVELTIVLTVAGVALLVWALRRSEAWLRRRGQAIFWRDVTAELKRMERERDDAKAARDSERTLLGVVRADRETVTKERDEARQELEGLREASRRPLATEREKLEGEKLEALAREIVVLHDVGGLPHMRATPYGPVVLGAAEHAARLERAIEALRAALA